MERNNSNSVEEGTRLEKEDFKVELVPVEEDQLRKKWMGRLSLVLLVVLMSANSLVLRYSRVKAGQPYIPSVVVLLNEASKLLICLTVQLIKARGTAEGNGTSTWHEYRADMHNTLSHALPMLLPAGLFIMQQMLTIIAATHLDAVAFQIFSQSFKLVPTAIFSYWLMGKHLSKMQWGAIPVLVVGVVVVTTASNGKTASSTPASAAMGSGNLGFLIGMLACCVLGLSSAYAGVYFEKYLKGENAASLWVRNIQLGSFGVPLSAAYMIFKDGSKIRANGMLQGFDTVVYSVVALSCVGGLVVGMVVKYCDNILKNFALAISVILTVIIVIPLFGQWPTAQFLVGVAIVLLSLFMYGEVLSPSMFNCCGCGVFWTQGLPRTSSGSNLGPKLKVIYEGELQSLKSPTRQNGGSWK